MDNGRGARGLEESQCQFSLQKGQEGGAGKLQAKQVEEKEIMESLSLEIFKTRLDAFLCNLLQGTCFSNGFGLDLQRPLPTPTVL